ncbi:MAG: tyrosine-type recombinase/integrase [Pyrinomonadaceae bacterium]
MSNQPSVQRAGQLYKRGDRTWLVRIFLGRDLNGKQKFHHKTVHGTKRDAQRYLTAAKREMDLGVFVEPAAMSLSEYLKRWLRDAARPRVSARTADGYASLLDRYIHPRLGHMRLDKIQPLDIQGAYSEMLIEKLSARVVRHTHAALHNALKQAVKWGLLSRNPSDFVELPKVPHKDRRVLSADEALSFLKAAEIMPNGLIFEFALLTGMRPEEYLAIRWSDVDFKRCTAQVQRALVRHKKSVTFEEPKTARSQRSVFLSNQLVQKLIAHKRKQAVQRIKLGEDWASFDLVFCGIQGTPLSIPNITYRYFRPILDAAKLPRIRLYDLRHSCATLLLIAEENPKVVSERLGHSTIVLTLDTYSHVLPTLQQGATARLEKLLYNSESVQESDTPVIQSQAVS